jgi:hypothetical protein
MKNRIVVPFLSEKRLALVHRVLVPGKEYPKEYAILVTDRRSIFIRQPKTRGNWVLRQEMKFGTALVTDATPKTLDEYCGTSLGALTANSENLTVKHEDVISLEMHTDPPERRRRDFFVWWVMKRQNEIFQVSSFDLEYRADQNLASLRFYAVPLGMYFKSRRLSQSRETILRDYAAEILATYRTVLPGSVVSSVPQTVEVSAASEFVVGSKRLS